MGLLQRIGEVLMHLPDQNGRRLRLSTTLRILLLALLGFAPFGCSTTDPRSHEVPTTAFSAPVVADEVFKFAIPFKEGKSEFLPGDQITISSVRGTSADMESGICCISGTYKLVSHDGAILAAFITAADAAQGTGPYNTTQAVVAHKGSGTFTLLLPINIRGWAHVSFYDGNPEPDGNEDPFLYLHKKLDFIQEDLSVQDQALAFKRKELDALAEKYGTTDLTSRDQQIQVDLVKLEGELDEADLDLESAKAAAAKDKVEALSHRIASLTKMIQQTRAQAKEVGEQRQMIEDVSAEIAKIDSDRDRDIRNFEELRAQLRQTKMSETLSRGGSCIGSIYIGTGDWVLPR